MTDVVTDHPLGMAARYGRAIHVIEPHNGRPLCENRSEVWSAPDRDKIAVRLLGRSGQPTCRRCLFYLASDAA